jgi:gamma-glutamyltranspeptidase/glutathione hydrolase
MEPAIEVAENGFTVTPATAMALKVRRDIIAQDPAAAKIFLKPDGAPYVAGEKIVQKDLAHTLRLISRQARDGFYKGSVAARILRTSRRLHGILAKKDLDAYAVKWREPLRGSFRGYELYTMPPPSSGGIHVLQILNILEDDPLKELGVLSPDSVHRTAAAMQLAYADRAVYPGDPDFVKVPTDWLISKDYARARRALIDSAHAKPASAVQAGNLPKSESPETTHFSIMDAEGNAVSSTQTINYGFGSCVVAEGTGILLNDEMDDFSAKPGAPNAYGALGGEANAIAPGKTPLSSMTPTIIVRNGKPVVTVGAPGGTTITTCVAQTILNYLAYNLSPYESVASVRMHEQWMPDALYLEPPGPGDSAVKKLQSMGWNVSLEPGKIYCRVELVVQKNGELIGVSDPRDSGRSVAH